MNRAFLVIVSSTAVLVLAPARAGTKHLPPPPPANQPLAPGALPSSVLHPWLDRRLDNLLSPLDRGAGLKHAEAATDLRSAIVDAMGKAPAEEQPAFRAAIAVCDVLCQAVDERRHALANFHGAGTQLSSDLIAHRKHIERQNAVRNQAFFAHANETQWLQRSAELRQKVSQLYAYERTLEAQVNAPSPAAPSHVNAITLEKPTTVNIKYGTATLPAGTTVRVVRRDAKGTVVEYNGELVTVSAPVA
jgi:hypothetical protein